MVSLQSIIKGVNDHLLPTSTSYLVAETRVFNDRPVDTNMASIEHYLQYGVRIILSRIIPIGGILVAKEIQRARRKEGIIGTSQCSIIIKLRQSNYNTQKITPLHCS